MGLNCYKLSTNSYHSSVFGVKVTLQMAAVYCKKFNSICFFISDPLLQVFMEMSQLDVIPLHYLVGMRMILILGRALHTLVLVRCY